ncbi:glycine-rich protein DC7.1-like [Papaver somniferum]|uniref:glycine-rich protein DC7.1-like n=1 Tax=Papaver somniferum TaxID=3469 RepID=UPI000E6F874E|nr:glycine-rich protein DC7.1-like [Papaver somniferum]
MGAMNNVRFFIFLGVLIAVVALVSSEVSAAKDLAETTRETAENNGLQDAKYGGNGYPGNGGYQGGGGYPGNGRGGGGRRGGGFRCRHGCCDRGGYYRGDCRNCCYSAAQANAFVAETTTTTNDLKP